MITQWWPPEPANVVGALGAELGRRGHDVDVVTGFPNYPMGVVFDGYRQRLRDVSDRSAGVRTIRVPLFPSHDQSAVKRAANYLSFAASASAIGLASAHRPDVAYVYHPPMTSAWPAQLQRLVRGTPFVLHIQDLWPESVLEAEMVRNSSGQRLLRAALDRACHSAYRAAAHIVVLSEGFKRLLVERGVPSSKISVVFNWADEAVFAPRTADRSVRDGLAPIDQPLALYAGNLGDYQNLEVVVEAASRFGSRLHLLLIGEGIARERLELLVKHCGAHNITIVPRVPPEQMPPILAAADVHIVSLKDLSFFRATIPGKTQVAMASAKPLIMGVRGDAAELVSRADAGWTCEPTVGGFVAAFEQFVASSQHELIARGERARAFYERELSLSAGVSAIEDVLDGARWQGRLTLTAPKHEGAQ